MDTLISKSTTERYFREYTGGIKGWEGQWWRTGQSSGDGYASLADATDEPLYDRYAPYANYWTDTRIVCEFTTVETTVVIDFPNLSR